MRTPEFIQRCLEAGIDMATALKAAKAFEAECEAACEELMEARRSKERARQAKHRAKKAQQDNGNNVPSRDVTLDDVNPVSERDLTCERAQVVTLTSSLRSEGNPPVSPIGLTAPKGSDAARGSRIPESFQPDEKAWEVGVLLLGGEQAAYGELDKFRDYWRSIAGAKGRKADWNATFRVWIRNAADRKPPFRQANDRPHDDKLTRKQANLARAFAGSERAAGFRGEP